MKSIVDKIRHLRRLSQSTNPHEAALAAATADRLIQQHRIEEAELEIESGDRSEPVEDETPLRAWHGRRAVWDACLVHGLAEHYDVASYNRRSTLGVRVHAIAIGRPEDVRLVREMYAYLHSEIEHISKAMRGMGRSAFASFRLGAVAGVLSAMAESKRCANLLASAEVAIVLASRYGEAEATLARLHPDLRKRRSRGPSDAEAYQAGVLAGRRIDTEGAKTKRLAGEGEDS
jgi:hypothetical protein